jgi:multiple sugar transport system substrate-binding protein
VDKSRLLRCFGLTLALTAPFVAGGCGSTARRDQPIHLKVWSMWTGEEERDFENVIAAYNKTHPGVIVENLGAVTDEKSVRAIIAGAPPDIFTLTDPSMLGTLAANNALEPLDARFQQAGFKREDFTPGSLEQCEYHGRLCGMPYLLDCITLMYNKRVFKDAGLDPDRPPQTFEEMEADCRKITKRDAEGKLTRIGLHPIDVSPGVVITMFDGKFVDGDRITADYPNNVESLTAYMRLMDDQGGYQAVQAFTSGFGANTSTYNPFFHGDVGMMVSGEWNPYWAWQYSPNTDYGVAPLPYPTDHPNRKGSVWLTDNLFCIPRGAKHVKEAWDFLAWTQSAVAQQMFASTLHNVPNIRAELHDRKLTDDPPFTPKHPGDRDPNSWRPYYGQFLALADSPTAASFPPLPVANLYTNQLANAFDSVGYGTKKPKPALAEINARVQREMDKYK